jgi:ribosomal protein S18 acetylase RimI-like enzyme
MTSTVGLVMQQQVVRLSEADYALAGQLSEVMLNEASAPKARLAELLEDRRNIVLACLIANAPVGYLVAHQFPSLSGARLVYLYDIEVAAGQRRQGIGRSLVAALLEVCRSEKMNSIWVGSANDNAAACGLWERTGATRASEHYVEFTYEL